MGPVLRHLRHIREGGTEALFWLRRQDSNLQSPDPESGGLPISRLLSVRSDCIDRKALKKAPRRLPRIFRHRRYCATRPPSPASVAPLMYEAASEHSQVTTLAISSGVP